MTTGAKTTFVLMLGTALFLVLALAVTPMHVTLGAGSLRCGTVVNPDSESEIADLCRSARSGHLAAAVVAGAGLAVLAALPLVGAARFRGGRPSALISSVLWLIAAGLALLFIGWFVEYSPPHEVFDL